MSAPQDKEQRLARRLPAAYGFGALGALLVPLAAAWLGFVPRGADVAALECLLVLALAGPPVGVLLVEVFREWRAGREAAEAKPGGPGSPPKLRLVTWTRPEGEPWGQVIRLFPAADSKGPAVHPRRRP